MKAFLAVTTSLGLLAAASTGALACSFHNDVSAEAPMTPIVTAERTKADAPVTPIKPATPTADQTVSQDKG
ncbi:hypothetical protein [Aurantimonas sp. VKM B-3413]|uniref:hypothetical protein n=1 Tax=Aurantimonas sp. VKM B-3413 TaxID=2779401 RepID=UPI001E365643|nr:hypothetical protein [Aurantimonas sp. VKM B-3413]MCB8840608.1 hypothetical protein [Aurantimonas sp. VKM B-3413]